MGDDAFLVCGGWWGRIGQNEDFSIFGWLGITAVFLGFRLSDMMDVKTVSYCTYVECFGGSVIFWKIEDSRM